MVEQGTVEFESRQRHLSAKCIEQARRREQIVQETGLTQMSDEGALSQIIDEVLASHPAQVVQFKQGKQQVLGFLVGQVMKASGGKANPGKVNELLKQKLG